MNQQILKLPFSNALKKFCYIVFLAMALAPVPGFAQSYYWDTNGGDPGTSVSSTGLDLNSPNWSTDPTGSDPDAIGYYTGSINDPDLVFSAGTNGTGLQQVTVSDQEFINSITVNNGSLTLVGSGNPNLAIDSGVVLNSTDGPTTFDSSLGTVSLLITASQTPDSQSWSNNSTQNLIINCNLTGYNGDLTFDGTGTGSTIVSGNISGNLGLVQSSTTSVLNLNYNGNTYTGGTTINGGTIVGTGSHSFGDDGTSVSINNGGTLAMTGGGNFSHVITVTGGGTLNFAGDTLIRGGDNTITADTLTIGTGDTLDFTTGNQAIQNLNFVGAGPGGTFSRFILGFNGGAGFINNSTVNVSNGYIFVFGTGHDYAPTNSMTFGSGTALETRNGGTLTLNSNVALPGAGTFTIGSDDVGTGAINVAEAYNVTGNLALTVQAANPTAVFLSGGITGNGNLTINGDSNNNSISPLILSGTNTYTNPLTISRNPSGSGSTPAFVEITGDSSGANPNYFVSDGYLALGSTAVLSPNMSVKLGSGTDGGFLQIGDGGSAANVTIGSLYASTDAGNPQNNDTVIGGNSAVSNLNVHVASGVTDVFYGRLGGDDNIQNEDNLSLSANGPGILVLTRGDSRFTGGVSIDGAGTIEGQDGAFGPDSNVITLTHGGQLFVGTSVPIYGNGGPTGGGGFNHAIVLGAGGGTIGGQYDYVIENTITGGTGLTVVSGDFLAASGDSSNNTGGITVTNSGTRLLMFNGGIISNNATINVINGGNFDFGYGGNGPSTVTNQINMGSTGAITDRGTNVNLVNFHVPTASLASETPTFSIGSDDLGGGSITVSNNQVLSSNVNIQVIKNQGSETGVYFTGGFSGTGNLSMSAAYVNGEFQDGTIHDSGTNSYQGNTEVDSGRLILTGDNTAVTSAGGGAPNYIVMSHNYDSTTNSGGLAYLQIGSGGSIASNSNLYMGSSQGFSAFVLGDGNGAVNQTIGGLNMNASAGDNATIQGGASTTSYLTVNVAANTTNEYDGLFGNNYSMPFQSNQDNLGVIFNIGTGGTMVLGGFQSDNIAGGFVVNGGTLRLLGGTGGILGTASTNVTLNNTTLFLNQGSDYDGNRPNQNFILGTGTNTITTTDGITSFGGVITGAGKVLHVSGPNMLLDPVSSTQSNYDTLDVDGGRVFIYGNNYAAILPSSTVNVAAGAVLDFATSSTFTSDLAYNFGANGGLVQRPGNGGPTQVTLTNANLPGQGAFTIGGDDENASGTVKVTTNQTLTGELDLAVNGSNTLVTLSGNISGPGSLKEVAGAQGSGNLVLSGTNTYAGPTTINNNVMYIQGDNSGAGTAYNVNFGLLDVGSTGSISNASVIDNNSGTIELGDAGGARNVTVANLNNNGGDGVLSYVVGGSSSVSTLTINNNSGDSYNGHIGNSGANQNNVALVKSGTGTFSLTNTNTYTGGTSVTAGKLAVDGSIVGNVVTSLGASIGGHGSIGGIISGAGSVDPGNSPGILTASATDPTGGMTYNFEMTQDGPATWSNAAASGNDVLHLNSGTPFTSALTAANVINVYFSGNDTTYVGGFFVDGTTDDLTSNIANATFNYYLRDSSGSYSYNGGNYDLLPGGVTMSVIHIDAAAFASGTVDGLAEQFSLDLTEVPEPSTWAMMLAGLGFLAFWQFRTRRLRN
jgi:fibronectin-binding autotransporter adhesin